MAFQAVPESAVVVINYLTNSEIMQNVVNARLVGGYDLNDLIALAVAVDAVVGTDWLPIQSNNAAYVSTVVRGLAAENDNEVTNVTSAGQGLVPQDTVPGNVTFSIKKSSGLTGRSARGRLYWLGIVRTQLSGNENVFNVADADNMVAAVEALRVAINATAWIAVIVSRFTGGFQRPFGETFNWVSTVAVNNNVDSQRKRLMS